MVIYTTTFEYKGAKPGMRLTFNRSNQYFETKDHEIKITNDESYRHPRLIKILKTVTLKSEQKRIINICF